MRSHGKGAKHVLVPRYRRWTAGKLQGVCQALRGADHKLSKRRSKDQLVLALERPES